MEELLNLLRTTSLRIGDVNGLNDNSWDYKCCVEMLEEHDNYSEKKAKEAVDSIKKYLPLEWVKNWNVRNDDNVCEEYAIFKHSDRHIDTYIQELLTGEAHYRDNAIDGLPYSKEYTIVEPIEVTEIRWVPVKTKKKAIRSIRKTK
jgi:hypothetical protein